VLGQRKFCRQGPAAGADSGDGKRLLFRFVQADAAQVDAEVRFEAAQHDLEDAAQILPLADGARDLVQQAEPFQLCLQFALREAAFARFAFQRHGIALRLGEQRDVFVHAADLFAQQREQPFVGVGEFAVADLAAQAHPAVGVSQGTDRSCEQPSQSRKSCGQA
jgi:hypothetical protein